MKTHPTKSAARAAVKAAGFTVLDGVSSSGDYAHGSREYYARPNAPKNQYGATMETVSISKLPGCWASSL